MENFTPLSGLGGGILIGLASALLLATTGRIAGISGIFGGLLAPRRGEVGWRAVFIIGLILGGLIWQWWAAEPMPIELQASWPLMLIAGFLVGFGSRLGSGCTSGHGVCGIGRMSARSLVATGVFMLSAAITVYVSRHLLGG